MSNTIIQIKRSTTSTVPGSLQPGELAFSGVSNQMYIGQPDGTGVSPPIAGAKYGYIENSTPGTSVSNAVLITDASGSLANLTVSGININGSVITGVATGISTGSNSQLATTYAIQSYVDTAVSSSSNGASNAAANAYANAVAYASSAATSAYNNAVSASAADATAKANTAYANAVATAASDASDKAANAYSNAVATAASDATSKADAAYSNAVSTAAADATDKAANAVSIAASAAASLYVPLAGGTVTGDLSVTGTTTVTAISANGSLGTAGAILASNGSSTYWATDADIATNVNATYVWTNSHTFGTAVTFGNSSVNTTVNSTFFTGTANNALFINGKAANTFYSKEWHVDGANGVDAANVAGTILAPFKTLTYALTRSGNTGEKIVVHQGIYTDNPVVSDLNIDIEGQSSFGSGVTYFPGTLTVNATSASGSVRIKGMLVNNFVHSGTAGVYLQDFQTRGALTKSSAGYLEIRNSDLQGWNFSGVTTISGNGYVNIYNTKIGTTSITNTAAIVTMQTIPSILAGGINATGGTIFLDKVIGVAASNTANIVATSGSSVIYITDSNFYTPAGTAGKIALNGFYSVKDVVYSEANSTFGTSLQSVSHFDNVHGLNSIRVANTFIANTTAVTFTGSAITATSADLSVRNATISGNLTVQGTVTTVDTATLTVKDPLIKLASGNATDTVDTGFYGQHGSTFSGLARIAASSNSSYGYYKLFTTSTEPTTTVATPTIDTLEAYLVSSGLVANSSAVSITANSTVSVSITANTLTLSTALDIGSGGTGRTTVGPAGSIMQSNGTHIVYADINGGIY
jgi:hypothetical protein